VSDRGDRLRSRRDFLRRELDEVERQLAAEEAAEVSPIAPSGRVEASADAEAEKILEMYRKPSEEFSNRTRKGCFMYFALAMLIFLSLSAVGIYLYAQSLHRH
jgi:hypothetical protein